MMTSKALASMVKKQREKCNAALGAGECQGFPRRLHGM
jgi:hypothetical protein